jgi:hypothetical protein
MIGETKRTARLSESETEGIGSLVVVVVREEGSWVIPLALARNLGLVATRSRA